MSRHRYDVATIRADYLRAAFGLAFTMGPVLLLDPAPVLAWVLIVLAILFAWFALRTGLRQQRWVEMSDEQLTLHGPFARRITWSELSRVRLAYYAPRRRSGGGRGWMQLTLNGPGGPIRIDSTLEGFKAIAEHAAQAARNIPLEFDQVTHTNFAALDVLEKSSGAD
jgi:hypothetical protein